MMGRPWRWQVVLAVFVLSGLAGKGTPAEIPVIFLDHRCSPEVRSSANDLAALLERDLGESPEIRRKPLFGRPRGLYIGPRPEHPAFDADPLTDQVMVIRDASGIGIHGADNPSTVFAIYRFIEAFLGWRQYQPGERGLERLDTPPGPLPMEGLEAVLLLETPGYHSRNLWSLGGYPESRAWGAWHGLRERFSYNHSLHNVVPPDRFAEHPEWFAKGPDGEPRRPPFDHPHGYNDHPDLSQPGLRRHVAETVVAALRGDDLPVRLPVRRSPGLASTSISLADAFPFGHYPADYPHRPEGWFRRWPDWSPHVFAFCNAVAEQVQAARPVNEDTAVYLGALAYLTWENTPDFAVHPWILPYLTFDRSQWHDPLARQDDLDTVRRWARTGVSFTGTWDYLFGYGFLIPRSLTGVVGESIPLLHRSGVRAYFSQMASAWPFDGHTTWLAARLLWNPEADPGELADEYFREYFGPAAVPMRAFFAAAESAWMNQSGLGWWLRYWKDPWQAALLSETDLDTMRTLLEEAVRKAGEGAADAGTDGLRADRFHQRVDAARILFEATEWLHRYQRHSWELQAGRPGPEETARLAAAALRARSNLAGTIARLEAAYPGSLHNAEIDWVFRYDSVGAALAEAARSPGPGAAGHREALEVLLARWAAQEGLEALPDTRTPPRMILFDPDFAHSGDPRIWHQHFLPSEGLEHRPLSPAGGFTVANARRGHLYQLFEAQPGDFHLGALEVDTRQSASGEVYLRIDYFDASMRLLGQSRRARIAPVAAFGQRQTVQALGRAPEGTVTGRVLVRFYEMDPGTRAEVHRVTVFRLPSKAIP